MSLYNLCKLTRGQKQHMETWFRKLLICVRSLYSAPSCVISHQAAVCAYRKFSSNLGTNRRKEKVREGPARQKVCLVSCLFWKIIYHLSMCPSTVYVCVCLCFSLSATWSRFPLLWLLVLGLLCERWIEGSLSLWVRGLGLQTRCSPVWDFAPDARHLKSAKD